MAASVLNTDRAVEVSLYVIRAFVGLRDVLASHVELERRLKSLEAKYDRQFKAVFDAIRALMQPAEHPERRSIGFVQDT